VPFVAIVVLLLVLIGLTPNLLSTGAPSAGSLPTEAELIIDRAPSDNLTHLYVHGIGEVRYTSIAIALDTVLSWPPSGPMSNLSFGTATTWKNSLAATLSTANDPFAVNITAVFVDSAGTTVDFVGVIAFDVASGTVSQISYVPSSNSITTTPVDQLPLSILLETVAPGSTP
jgi:hypothetical protein